MKSFAENIKKQIDLGLPGEEAWVRMIPKGRVFITESVNLRKASVLILLYPKAGDISLALIKRTLDNGPHSGQVSFPGGKSEENDINGEYTAIRETAEETGIQTEDLKILGKLTDLTIPVSQTLVSPYIGFLNYEPVFKPDPYEVEYIIEVNMRTLFKPEIMKSEPMDLSGITLNVPYFHIHGEKVWGATAMILAEFIDLAGKVGQGPGVQY